MTLRSVVCEAIREAGWSISAAAKEAGMPVSSLQRFCQGEQGIEHASLERLTQMFGLELVLRLDWQTYVAESWPDVLEELLEGYRDARSIAWQDHKRDAWMEHEQHAWQEHMLREGNERWERHRDILLEKSEHPSVDDSDYQEWLDSEFEEWRKAEHDEWYLATYDEWHANEYDQWSREYDAEHYSAWAAAKLLEERERLEAFDWIIIEEGEQ